MTYTFEIADWKSSPERGWGECEHVVQFYETDSFLLSSVSEFVRAGLEADEAVIVIAAEDLRAGLVERLRAVGLDVAAVASSGQYVSLNAAQLLSTFMREGHLDPERFTEVVGRIVARAAEGRRRVWIFGEMVALLWAEENYAAAIELERLWNELQKTQPFSLLCGYPMGGLGREALAHPLRDVCMEHSRVVPAESYSALASPDDKLRAIALLQQKAASLEAEIGERRAAEQALRESEAALSRSLHVRDEFLSAVSHDRKTPLTVLQGQAQVLRRRAARGTLTEEKFLQGLESIEDRSRKMARLVDELLDLTRLHAGQELQLDRRVGDLVALARQVVEEYQETTRRHVLLVHSNEPTLSGWWDYSRLGRVIENLVSNAIKYSPEGGEIEVSLRRERSPEGDWAVLTVRDEGIGIPEEDLPHIFEQFYRGKNASSTPVGTGVGLAAARQIVEHHGGTITVNSREAVGSVFTLRLPIDVPSRAVS